MTMRTLLLVAPAALFIGACTDGSGKDDSGTSGSEEADSDTDTDADTDADSDADTDADTDTDVGAAVSGTAVWADGSPAEGVQMRLCYETCRTANTDGGGAWTFSGVENVDHTLQAVVLGDTSYAVPHSIVMLRDDESRSMAESYRIDSFVTKTDLTEGGTADVSGDGITIDAVQASITAGSYTPDYGEYYVATVEVDPATAGLSWDGLDGSPVAMWYLGNFDSTVDPPFPFTTESTYGLDVGSKVNIWSTSSEEHAWVSGGTGTVTEDGIVTDGGSGIRKLTTLVLTVAD